MVEFHCMKNLSINKSKRIGQVIYVVEGDVFEASLLQHIYCDVLGYEVVSYDKRSSKCIYLTGRGDKYSRVFIVPAKYSAINKITDSEDYFGKVYSLLSESYDLDVDNSALYFVFDRDRKSNRTQIVVNAICRYVNAREGIGYDRNGMLLLNYPSSEAMILNCIKDTSRFDSGQSIKDYIKGNRIEIGDITEKGLLCGTELVLDYIEEISGESIQLEFLDNFENINRSVFDKQELLYSKNKLYYTLSLIVISLLDLGIVSLDV